MTNVIKITSYRRPQRIIERAREYAAMPAAVTGNPELNRKATELQKKGWTLRANPNGEIFCHSKNMHSARWIDIHEAHILQRTMENVK